MLTQEAFTDCLWQGHVEVVKSKYKEVDVGDHCMFFYKQQEKTIP